MSLLQSIILGIIQGLTEFLPISSSGHLVILPYLLRWELPAESVFFDVLVQVATLLAVFINFWSDMVNIGRAFILGLLQRRPFATPMSRLGWFLILASFPAAIIGLTLRDVVKSVFVSPPVAAVYLLVTAALLTLAERLGKREKKFATISWRDAIWIGIFQALAIFPGISRSGATISAGMMRNLKRTAAARFSFLMSIPIMLAAGVGAGAEIAEHPDWFTLLPSFIPGFLAAAIVGYLSIRWLLKYLARFPLYLFAIYCAALGFVTLLLFYSGY